MQCFHTMATAERRPVEMGRLYDEMNAFSILWSRGPASAAGGHPALDCWLNSLRQAELPGMGCPGIS